jgi:phage/plasmid-like protein (TIGR03299 family)
MTEHDQMYSVREAPWHLGSGTNVLMLDAAPETRMARIDAAGHAFTVEETDVHLRKERPAGDDGQPEVTYPKVEGWKALTRSDTGVVLNVARGSYEVVQNIVGHELFEALSIDAKLDDGTGGTVRAGAVCYLSARVDEPQTVTGDDSPIYPYVVVLWTHDGSGALQARRTSVRPVCWNTISLGEAEARRSGRNFTFRHTKNVLARIEEAKRVIAGARQETAAFVELANELARMSVTLPVTSWAWRMIATRWAAARASSRSVIGPPLDPGARCVHDVRQFQTRRLVWSSSCMNGPCSSRSLSRSNALAMSLRIPNEISGAISLSNPPGLGAMTSLTFVPGPASDSSHQPEGSIEPGPALAGGPSHASMECGSNSVRLNVPFAPRAIS